VLKRERLAGEREQEVLDREALARRLEREVLKREGVVTNLENYLFTELEDDEGGIPLQPMSSKGKEKKKDKKDDSDEESSAELLKVVEKSKSILQRKKTEKKLSREKAKQMLEKSIKIQKEIEDSRDGPRQTVSFHDVDKKRLELDQRDTMSESEATGKVKGALARSRKVLKSYSTHDKLSTLDKVFYFSLPSSFLSQNQKKPKAEREVFERMVTDSEGSVEIEPETSESSESPSLSSSTESSTL